MSAEHGGGGGGGSAAFFETDFGEKAQDMLKDAYNVIVVGIFGAVLDFLGIKSGGGHGGH